MRSLYLITWRIKDKLRDQNQILTKFYNLFITQKVFIVGLGIYHVLGIFLGF